MTTLPHGARARLPMAQGTDDCLHPEHSRGKDQARVFAAVLGLTRAHANALAALVRQAAMEGDLTKEARTVLGRCYRVDWAIPTRGNAVWRTIGDIAPGEAVPRLLAAFMHACKEAHMGHPKPLDVVALLQPISPESLPLTEEGYDLSAGLPAGTVGTVLDVFPQPAESLMCLVELSDARGGGYTFATVPAEALLVFHYAPLELMVARP
jgi:hypothetical protein